ncbi:NUDIX hydrolase [Rhodococcoides kyotonense]|uniref:ADP-ribose pyrophosphatase YjhB, NUDIX family n=1 Tax=Rhodococcoides kyotonense TaxID=398843 RepID=A0A239IGZ4_9NOCA|nr:NUDIX hydrolase [Rhodococcus kyotonensis]SNS92835.1 ADP-ribose pyrophosphatase YjhB, NUDIX family [Rhodococcus kyotonensis]
METDQIADKALTDYPRPSVAVDVAVLTVHDDALKVVVVPSPRGDALPGTFLHPGERLADAADRALRTKAGLGGLDFHQIGMFDAPDRDERGWVLSMAHGATVAPGSLTTSVALVEVHNGSPTRPLAFDHDAMTALSVEDLRRRYASSIDPGHLLGDTFTLLELRRLYEVVFDNEFAKDTFRRHVTSALEGTGETSIAGGGRPAELYRRTPEPRLPESASALFRS